MTGAASRRALVADRLFCRGGGSLADGGTGIDRQDSTTRRGECSGNAGGRALADGRPAALVVFDAAGGVYVSTDPDRFPMSMPPEQLLLIRPGAEFIRHPPPDPVIVVDRAADDFILLVSPIRADGIHLGALVMAYSKAAFTTRITRLVEQAAIVTGLILGLLVPVTWYWGSRMAKPLVDLAENMAKVSSPIPTDSTPWHSRALRTRVCVVHVLGCSVGRQG